MAQTARGQPMTRVATMLTTAVTTVALGSSAFVDPPKTLIWNASTSAPVGLYAVQAANDLAVTDLVAVMPPPLIAEFLADRGRSEEHTSELQSLMRISYAVFCLKKKKQRTVRRKPHNIQ